VSEAIAERGQLPDGSINLVCFLGQRVTVEFRNSVGAEDGMEFIERESRGLTCRDQCQSRQHGWIKEPPQTTATNRLDKALLLVMPQGRSREARAFRHLRNVQIAHAIDLKSTPQPNAHSDDPPDQVNFELDDEQPGQFLQTLADPPASDALRKLMAGRGLAESCEIMK
jgi:hypothetical protein